MRRSGTPFNRNVGRCHSDASSALESTPLHNAGNSGGRPRAERHAYNPRRTRMTLTRR